MTASPQTRNYLYGKGELFFRAVGSEGYDHLGNAPAFTISLTEEKLEHFSSMSGTKTKDLQLVTQKGAAVAFTLEEFTTGNILRAFKGAAVAKQMQAAATVSGQSVSANKGLYTFVGKEKLGFTRLEHGTVAGGTFAPGSSVVGSTSSATATVAYVTDGVLECVNVRGTFVPGEEIAASAIKATLQGIARVADVVLTDKASAPTVRYRQGVDYDLNARTGLLRVRESCSADTVFLTADCESSDEQLVDALTASDVTGELLFVGQPDQGPGLVVQCWKVTLSLSGEVGLISEELASIPMTGEVLALLVFILYVAVNIRHRLSMGLALGQLAGMIYLDFFMLEGHQATAFLADPLALVMVLVISLVGGIVCIFGLGYMQEHEDHLRLAKSKQSRFFFFLLLFLGAMNGLVLCDSLTWVFFFWEITTLCSFFLISHDGTREAKRNATRALWMNMVGGIGFLAAMLFMQKAIGTLSIQAMLAQSVVMHSTAAMLPIAFLCFAAFTKSAQLPFQSWLCGAMVAPTPVSALLHSSTMVKAGVYLVLRLSPAFAGTMLAGIVSLTGAFTFVAASALACGQSNGKKILAYSTIANLGLIIACAGMATPAAITAAILLIIFHAVSKGLLFLCVGTIEQHIGSRDIESMRGLYKIMPRVAVITLFGIVTMMLPPFGALLAKWIAIEASASAPAFMPVLVVLIAFGSALTVLFWARWAGLLLGSDPLSDKRPVPEHLDGTMSFALRTLLYGAIALSLFVPWIFSGIEQSIASLFGVEGMFASDWGILTNGRGLFAVYPMFFLLALGMWYALRQSKKAERGPCALPYLSGIQYVQDGKVGFNGPLNTFVEPKSSNYYMEAWFGEQTLTGRINTIAIVLMVVMLGGLL